MKTHCNCWIYSIFKVKYKMLLFFLLLVCALSKITDVGVVAEMTTFSPPPTDHNHHIISFVGQKRNKQKVVEHGVVRAGSLKSMANKPNVMENFFERIVQKLDTDAKKEQLETDDLLLDEPNTLVNTVESWEDKNKSTEVRRSIPVLEPVRHLLNTVRDGGFNHTISRTMSKNPHHHLFVPNGGMASDQNESSAIETEEEREMVNESTELQFLDFAGRFGAKIWGFFTNLQRIFAASSGMV